MIAIVFMILLKKINYKKTDNPSDADYYLLNTCHIREKAADKVHIMM